MAKPFEAKWLWCSTMSIITAPCKDLQGDNNKDTFSTAQEEELKAH